MKIGIYCTNNFAYPLPDKVIYANIDIAVWEADSLVDLGEDVTLFAPIGTRTRAKLVTFDQLPFEKEEICTNYPDEGSSYQYENIMAIDKSITGSIYIINATGPQIFCHLFRNV